MKKTMLYVAFNSAVNPMAARRNFERLACKLVGGFTRQDAVGGWTNEDTGEVVVEESCIYTFHGLDEVEDGSKEMAEWLARYTGEHALLWEDAQGNGTFQNLDEIRKEMFIV